MAEIIKEKKTTKDLIINAAFSFFKEPSHEDFSMSQLAARVGITKTALYRHFKNKDDILSSLETCFFDLLGSRIAEIQKIEKEGQAANSTREFEELICFFADTPEYVNFFINKFTNDPDFEETMRSELKQRGVRDEFEEFYKTNLHGNLIKRYAHSFYCGTSLLFFIKIRERLECALGVKTSGEEFSKKIIRFIQDGFAGRVKKNSFLYPSEISKVRMAELDALSAIKKEDLPEEDRIFKAFASVIKKYGMCGVTVERIASELNMAKSSLYFYFENKNQMIYSLVAKELNLLRVISRENSLEAKNYTEYLYISLRTEISYFIQRESVLSICGWLLQSAGPDSLFEDECDSTGSVWDDRLAPALEELDLGFPLNPQLVIMWLGLLPVSLTVLKMKHALTDEEIVEALKYVFSFVMYGAGA